MHVATLPLAALVLSLAATTSTAQDIVKAWIDGQPLVYTKDGVVEGCGVRVIVVDVPANKSAPITAYDASFNLQAPDRGVVRAATSDATLADFESRNPERRKAVAPESFWFKADGAKATAPNERMSGRMAQGAEAGSVIYLSDLEPVVALFSSQSAGKPILMGVKRPGVATEKVFRGTIEMSEGETAQLASCMKALSRRM